MEYGAGANEPVSADYRAVDPQLSDVSLVTAARGGDMRAFERLYRTHSGKVMGLCLRMTRRRDVAEDCVQQTFIRAWKNLQAFEGRSPNRPRIPVSRSSAASSCWHRTA